MTCIDDAMTGCLAEWEWEKRVIWNVAQRGGSSREQRFRFYFKEMMTSIQCHLFPRGLQLSFRRHQIIQAEDWAALVETAPHAG
jgi:hypothetical protein